MASASAATAAKKEARFPAGARISGGDRVDFSSFILNLESDRNWMMGLPGYLNLEYRLKIVKNIVRIKNIRTGEIYYENIF